MLKGAVKKMTQEAIRYYIDTTGGTSDKFITEIMRNNNKPLTSETEYNTWLAIKIFRYLEQNGVNLADCLEFRNLAKQLKLEKKGMNVTPLWKKEIAKCISSSKIDKFELFELSDRNSELNYIESEDKEVTYCGRKVVDDVDNFFNVFDFDEFGRFLYNVLPAKLQSAINLNLPIFINMNPYLEHNTPMSRLYNQMQDMGVGEKKFLTPFFGCLYKVMDFCDTYNLQNVRIGFFAPLNMFYEEDAYLSFYRQFKEKFKFNRGICFNPKSVGVNVKEELISYMIWDLKVQGDKSNRAVVLDMKVQQTDDSIIDGASHLIRGNKVSLYDWEMSSVNPAGVRTIIPKYASIQVPLKETSFRYSNVLGFQANTPNLFRACTRVGVYSVPVGDCSEITTDSLYKSAASYVVRTCVGAVIDKPKHLNAPDMMIEGFQEWSADAIIFFLFNDTNMTKSYREKDLVLSNRLFPLKITDVERLITDVNILDDIKARGSDNLFIIQMLESIYPKLSATARELYLFCRQKIIDSLIGSVREDIGYKDSLVAWDASLYQIRRIETVFTKEVNDKYVYLLSRLQDRLNDGVYKYGFVTN